MSTQESNAETIFVSKLRKTETLPHARVRQIFDMVNLPGMQVICISHIGDDGEFEIISQTYELANGAAYDTLDDALLAWDDMSSELALLDTIGNALLRHHHGLIRPLWEHRTAEQKWPWITRARQFKGVAESLGLSITQVRQ
jgi:hypothetical protein